MTEKKIIFSYFQSKNILEEINQLLKRTRLLYDTHRFYSTTKREEITSFPSLSSSLSSSNSSNSSYISPRIDLELIKVIFLYLKNRLLSNEDILQNTITLDMIIRGLQKSPQKKIFIPLRQQLELSLLWYGIFYYL